MNVYLCMCGWIYWILNQCLCTIGLRSALHTTWNYRRKSKCSRNRTCKSSEMLIIHIYEVSLNLLTFVTISVYSWYLQVLDRATEETPGYCEDVNYEGQHNQHLCHGKFVDYIHSSFIIVLVVPSPLLCCSIFSSLSPWVCLPGVPALFLSHHFPISQSIWWKQSRTEGTLHTLLQ